MLREAPVVSAAVKRKYEGMKLTFSIKPTRLFYSLVRLEKIVTDGKLSFGKLTVRQGMKFNRNKDIVSL